MPYEQTSNRRATYRQHSSWLDPLHQHLRQGRELLILTLWTAPWNLWKLLKALHSFSILLLIYLRLWRPNVAFVAASAVARPVCSCGHVGASQAHLKHWGDNPLLLPLLYNAIHSFVEPQCAVFCLQPARHNVHIKCTDICSCKYIMISLSVCVTDTCCTSPETPVLPKPPLPRKVSFSDLNIQPGSCLVATRRLESDSAELIILSNFGLSW